MSLYVIIVFFLLLHMFNKYAYYDDILSIGNYFPSTLTGSRK